MKIAIIGSGIAGLGSAWYLRNHAPITEIQIFEASAHLGGHARTATVNGLHGAAHIDTGFMVYNEVTYPLLTELFADLEVETIGTDMSFSVQHQPDNLTYKGGKFQEVFAQKRNLTRPKFWRMAKDISAFYQHAIDGLNDPKIAELTLQQFADHHNYKPEFLRWYLIPMAGAVWSSPPEKTLHFPAQTLLRFWYNHGFLGAETRHPWRTIQDGSSQYVHALLNALPEHISAHANTPVTKIERPEDPNQPITLHLNPTDPQKTPRQYHADHLIIATHAPQAKQLINQQQTPLEKEILAPFQTQPNHVQLHSDTRPLPQHQAATASWNYRISADQNGQESTTTHYYMNQLQPSNIPQPPQPKKDSTLDHYLISLNSQDQLNPNQAHLAFETAHPLFDLPAIQAQARLPELHDHAAQTRTHYAGAWQRYGFHEDGLHSAKTITDHLKQGTGRKE